MVTVEEYLVPNFWNLAEVTATVLLRVWLGQAYDAVTEVAASDSGSNSSSNEPASVVVGERFDGRSTAVLYVGTWDFDRNHGPSIIIRVPKRIIVAREGYAS